MDGLALLYMHSICTYKFNVLWTSVSVSAGPPGRPVEDLARLIPALSFIFSSA